MDITISKTDEQAYTASGNKAMDAVSEIVVVDDASNAAMGEVLSKIKKGMKIIEDKLNEPIEKAHQLHRWLTQTRAKVLAPWKLAETEAKKRMADYQYGLMVAKRDAEAKAERERQKLEAERERKSEAAMAKGDRLKSEAILQAPIVPKTVVPEVPKTEKQTAVFDYTWEIMDQKLIPKEFYILDVSTITSVVKKEKLNCRIPGIRVIECAAIRSRA